MPSRCHANIPPRRPAALPPCCPHHRRPLPMRLLGQADAASGDALLLYACADPQCRYCEGFGPDRLSGQLRRLLHGFDQSRR